MLMPSTSPLRDLENAQEFIARHIGITPDDEQRMLGVIGEASRQALIDNVVPAASRAA
jgi:glycine dehydrogenase